MLRRDFLKYSVALGVASALPLWSRAAFAAERPALPIPDLLTADASNRMQLIVKPDSPHSPVRTRQPGATTVICWGQRYSFTKEKA